MTITFFSNFLNHHQLPLCQEFIKQVGDGNFHFVSCERIHEERAKMGYEDMNIKYPFVVRAYESDDQMQKAIKLAHESDVAIIGSAFQIFTDIRGEENKLTFLYRERIFKNGSWRRFIPTTAWKIFKGYTQFRNKNFYILCASAYAADDFAKCGFPRHKCLKWGYFPELLPKAEKSFEKLRIMWCGRMIWWKHPEDAVEVARLLKEKGVKYEMKIIGNGDKRGYVETLIDRYNLRSCITTYDFMSPSDIRKSMTDSNVYLFTSGREEGWGVVLNEAMNSGCVVIANSNAGSSPYLIQDGVNGLLYDGSIESLNNAVNMLINTSLSKFSNASINTISRFWNPIAAAESLLDFVINSCSPKEQGPCSLS